MPERFIEQQHFGLIDQGARQGHSLLLSTGQLVGFLFAWLESSTSASMSCTGPA